MADEDLSNVSSAPPVFPSDHRINNQDYTLSEIKRILYWAHHADIQKRKENGYIAYHTASVPASGGTTNIHLKNPSDSGFSIDLASVRVDTQFEGRARVFDGFSSGPSGGSENGIGNLLLDTNDELDTGDVVVNTDVSFTSGSSVVELVLPGGGKSKEPVGGAAQISAPLIEPGREIVVEVENMSEASGDASIVLTYFEEGHVYSTE